MIEINGTVRCGKRWRPAAGFEGFTKMNRQKSKALAWSTTLVLGLFCHFQSAQADDYFVIEPNLPCLALMEKEFNDELLIAGKQVAIRKNSSAINETFKLGFDYFAELRGKNERGSIHRETATNELVMVIPDRDLPCRALVSMASEDDFAGLPLAVRNPGGRQAPAEPAPRLPQPAVEDIVAEPKTAPEILIGNAFTKGKQGTITGRIRTTSEIVELTIDGSEIDVGFAGNFEFQTFVPTGGINVEIEATDSFGLTSRVFLALERPADNSAPALNFDRLNPLGRSTEANGDALALIVGVANYENTSARAVFADSDALMFKDFASEKLGIPESRINTLVDEGADFREVLLGVKRWLSRAVRQGQSDVYIFFAGHGLATDDGETMYLLPYDGAPELLEDTAVSTERLFSDIAAAMPRSVTVFLDTCYSGNTRGPEMLIASRPISIRAREQTLPDGFTVITAAAGDQTAKPLQEAKHGMFSYFLMKGMEGDADANKDDQITAGELHAYVLRNVIQQSGGSQTPQIQGDADRVLVRFQ